MADASASIHRQSERTTHLTRIFRPKRPIEVFLDVGCGTGTITREIQAAYDIPLAVGIDLHPGTATDQQEADAAALEFGLEEKVDQRETFEIAPVRRPVAPMAIDFDDEPQPSPAPVPPKVAAKPLSPLPKSTNDGNGKRSTQRYIYRQLKCEVIPMPDNSVDLVTVFMAIHHFDRFEQMLSELQRVLRPDGFLFIREHDVGRSDALLRKTLDNMHASFSDHMTSGVTNYWPREDLRRFLVDRCGLRHVLDDDYPPDVPNPQHIYHSLYAKPAALTDLKYVPPSERSTKTAAPATTAGAKSRTGKPLAGKADGQARMSDNWRK